MRILALVLGSLCLSAWAEPLVNRDVPYREPADSEPRFHSLDIYAPPADGAHPVLVYVHGGGWRAGDKARAGRKPEFFTDRGWVFVSINYRLLPAGRHPANVNDVAAAIAWVGSHIADYGGDPTRIVVMGHSAGAHLAALVATDPRPLRRAGASLAILRGAIPIDTLAYDVAGQLAAAPGSGQVAVFGNDPAVHQDASPQAHLDQAETVPPFLICFTRGMAGDDSDRRGAAANAFAAALRAAGVEAEVVDASDRTHREVNERIGDPSDERVTGRIVAFLDRIVAANPGAPAAPL